MIATSRHLALCIVLLLASILPAMPAGLAERMVWPPAPDRPRIEFVRSFTSPADLGIEKGLFARFKEFLFGAADERLVRPMAVVARAGIIHVADPGVRGVHRFDLARGEYALIRAADDLPLPSPVGLALGPDGTVYATDSVLGKVFVIRPESGQAVPLVLSAPLRQPTGIAYDAGHGRLIVTDTAAHQIVLLSRDGREIRRVGRRGNGNGEFNYPTHLWLDGQGRLLVTDSLNFRIQTFDADGGFTGMFGRQGDGTGDTSRAKGVATDRYGHIYVTDALFHAVQIFDGAGRLLLPIGGQGHDYGEFWLPAGLFVDTADGDTIYVADSHNRRIQVMRYVGGAT
ncbi:MAG: 6-bladed beta-propeller [Rhodocyclaceae bacterium]|jgi:sugar lactone lactonase YvrE|nr:6-bladed beta-propeller [Rhodocyclaceae bacterium]